MNFLEGVGAMALVVGLALLAIHFHIPLGGMFQ